MVEWILTYEHDKVMDSIEQSNHRFQSSTTVLNSVMKDAFVKRATDCFKHASYIKKMPKW